MPRRKDQYSVEDLGEILKGGLRRAVSRPSIFGYVPHDKQIRFHSDASRGRLYIGGNRSGKTVGGVVEDIWRLRGQHPYRNVPSAPVRGRIVTTSYTEGVKLVIIPELQKWLPPSELINGSWEDSYQKADRLLTLANGSTCELMSYDQDVDKFAGTSRHFVHFDEEPPKAIFTECKMRLLDTAGDWYMTMTPVDGMTWVYDDIYLPGMVPGSNIGVIIIDTEENPYITNAEIEEALSGLDSNERKARKEGKFVQLGGLVYRMFHPDRNIVSALSEEKLQRIRGWTHYASMDHGFNNPTAWLFHAVSPNGLIVTYDEIYASETLVSQFATQIKERLKLPGRVWPEIFVGDPAISQRNAQTGDSIKLAYMQQGIPIVLGNNDVRIGVNKMNAYLGNGKWVISESCPNLIRELQRVKWKIFDSAKKRHDNNPREEIHKLNDHAPDSARYFFSLMPDLYIPHTDNLRRGTMSPNEVIAAAVGAGTATPVGPIYTDTNLGKSNSGGTEWHTIDETVGGWH
jgi:phage terminase large subunit-like protein